MTPNSPIGKPIPVPPGPVGGAHPIPPQVPLPAEHFEGMVEVKGTDSTRPVIEVHFVLPKYAQVVVEVQWGAPHAGPDPMGQWNAFECHPLSVDTQLLPDAETRWMTSPIDSVQSPDHRGHRGHARAVLVTRHATWTTAVASWEVGAG